MMKLVKILAFLVLIFGYLFLSYIRFYHFIGDVNLKSPFATNAYVLTGKSGTPQTTYVALGDSLAAGVGSLDINQTYPYEYALRLATSYKKVNMFVLAIPGANTADLIAIQLDKAVSENPEYVTLQIGVNDIHNKIPIDTFEKNYKTILDALLNKTKAKIVVLNLPYLGSSKVVYPPFTFLLDYRTKQFNKVIENVVQHNDRIKLIDIYTSTKQFAQHSDFYSSDLFHPSGKGYVLWGNVINEN